MDLSILAAIFLFLLATLTACGFGYFILRELRKTQKILNAPPAPPAAIQNSVKLDAVARPQNTTLPATAPKPQPADNAKLYRQAPLSPAERAFLDFLTETIDGQYLIQTKTRLQDLFKRYGRLERELYTMHAYGHVDFCLLDPRSKTPVIAIELDDATHDRPERQDADRRKEILFERADMKLLRFRKGVRWGEAERNQIKQALPNARD